MSLILEALRKSEAERRRGSAPDLARELPPPTAPVPTVRRTWWLAGGAGLVLALALLAWAWRPAAEAPARVGVASAAPGAAAPSAVRDSGPTSTDVGRTGDSGASDAPPWPAVARIAPATMPPADATRDADAAAMGAGDAGEPGGAGEPPPSSSRALADDGAAATASDAPSRNRRHPLADAAGEGRPGSPVAAVVPDLRGVPDARDVPELRLSALSADARARLPPLKLTMHLWNDEPAARFVILDGQRLGVGDRVGGGTVDAIDADGVVISLDGQRVRLPLR